MNFIKLIILFAVVALLVYGFSGLSGKDSVAFTFLSFGFSAVIAAFFWIMIVLLVALYLFASSSISIYPKMLFLEGTLFGWWYFVFNFLIPDGQSLTLLGVNIYNLGGYFIYGTTVLIGIGIVMMMCRRSTNQVDKVKKHG